MQATEIDTFHVLAEQVRAGFAAASAFGGGKLYTTDAGDLFATYLDGFGDPADRQHHNCSRCRSFLNRYGHLVVIDQQGTVRSAMWDFIDTKETPILLSGAVLMLRAAVKRAKINGVFASSATEWGTAKTGEWNHFAVTPAPSQVYQRAALTAGQQRAEYRKEFDLLRRGLDDFSLEVFTKALAMFNSGVLNRSDRFLETAADLVVLKTIATGTRNQQERDAHLWRAVATQHAGFVNFRNSVIGSLLEDLAAGLPAADITGRFNAKTRASVYQRAEVAPAAGAIEAAEKLVEKLGIAPALPRRYARLDELPALWKPVGAKPADQAGTVFGHIAAKEVPAAAGAALDLPATTITWDKFRRTVLPGAMSLEALVPRSADRFAALVTAVDEKAPPILQWDRAEQRNPFSWYYASGIDAEIKRRVIGAGGQHADVDIRASLIWNNRNDLDLHVLTPAGHHIYFGAKRGLCGGWLDVDMNIGGETTTPVENIRWQKGVAPEGRYRFFVENYRFHEPIRAATPFRVELEVNGEILHFDGATAAGANHTASQVVVADFHYSRSGNSAMHTPGMRAPSREAGTWGLAPGAMVKVNAIVESPNMWGDKPTPHHGQHAFFVLDGCRDKTAGLGRGFFTEMLNSELRPARATLEAYAAAATIAGAEEADACGLGMSNQAPWDLVLRVHTAAITQLYKIDRWD